MRSIAFRFLLLFLGVILTSAMGAQSPARPTIPAMAKITLAGVDYVNVTDLALVLGLTEEWIEPGRRLALKDKDHDTQIELSIDTFEAKIQGLRFFLGDMPRVLEKEMYVSRIDAERSLLSKLRPALIGRPPKYPQVIVIDPGHGGSDPGMENKRLKLQEKILTLDVALRLKKILSERGFKVVLTREKDEQLGPTKVDDFKARAKLANLAGADLFVSIHFNSLDPDMKTNGSEIYTFTPAFQRSRRATTLGEDDIEREAAPVNRFDPWSSLLAQSIHGSVLDQLKTTDRGHKTMHSALMRGVQCPAVLVESVFLSNDHEARLAATPAYRQKMAEAIALGIFAYAAKLDAIAK